jgi:hypothetical protein
MVRGERIVFTFLKGWVKGKKEGKTEERGRKGKKKKTKNTQHTICGPQSLTYLQSGHL